MTLPRLAITIGDPAGIGPEIVEKAITNPSIYKISQPIVVGDVRFIPSVEKISKKYGCIFEDVPAADFDKIKSGRYNSYSGKTSYMQTAKAVELIEKGQADAIVTAPVSKAAMKLAGINYPGQTELLADLFQSKNYAMLMVCDSLITAMVTRHLAVSQISKNITVQSITSLVKLLDEFLKEKMGLNNPKIGVCALNPHAGEDGLLGGEERNIISPAISVCKENGIELSGPYPADNGWVRLKKREFNALVGMYHDQIMIGLKCIAPEKIVNVTAGLPVIRTSPGHGTAFDIAGQNLANPDSMIEAIKFAARYSSKRQAN